MTSLQEGPRSDLPSSASEKAAGREVPSFPVSEAGEELPRTRRTRTRRWLLFVGLLALVDLFALPPKYQPSSRVILLAIDAYQATLSKAMPSMGVQCRFTPTCSHYSEAAIDRLGTVRGGLAMLWRLVRCGPWTDAGTVDPPPGEPAKDPPDPSPRSDQEARSDCGLFVIPALISIS